MPGVKFDNLYVLPTLHHPSSLTFNKIQIFPSPGYWNSIYPSCERQSDEDEKLANEGVASPKDGYIKLLWIRLKFCVICLEFGINSIQKIQQHMNWERDLIAIHVSHTKLYNVLRFNWFSRKVVSLILFSNQTISHESIKISFVFGINSKRIADVKIWILM